MAPFQLSEGFENVDREALPRCHTVRLLGQQTVHVLGKLGEAPERRQAFDYVRLGKKMVVNNVLYRFGYFSHGVGRSL